MTETVEWKERIVIGPSAAKLRRYFLAFLAVAMMLGIAATQDRACSAQAIAVTPAPPSPASPQAGADDFPNRELLVGTKEAPPFAMKDSKGAWTGISIELWQHIAEKLGVRFRFVEETSVQSLVDKTARGSYDLSIAAITIAPDRERMVDFSQPFYSAGLGIAVPVRRALLWPEISRTLTSSGFFQAAGVLIGLALFMGALIWLFEHRHNEDFGGGAAQGLGASIWWSAEAMTQASTGLRGPKTMAGRALAIIWMIGSIITIAVFTASVTSALTTREIRGLVNGLDDLPRVRVGAVGGTSSIGFLDAERIRYRSFQNAKDGLTALSTGSIDAFVYDKPLLSWIAAGELSGQVEILDNMFDQQGYGIAMPVGSRYRRAIDLAMLEMIDGEWWKHTLFRYLREKR
ncbi:transporter substrate-binding domain-containing protein [Mesorhizobium sp. BAC0120]|uniref:transporter substrate-binding domain-containing protein n=1 Tax=Mesorhizobium sp. BAC0120 TaxID=3090670 RepID=UPI00298D368C|nr:transporter substrate-binding domain-containing protein [Mesorhizobium sp. BAC0120]MDW6025283.1 transporter substrate-binding domain-containing protein [Mesorhizobium sp. BAC0120]